MSLLVEFCPRICVSIMTSIINIIGIVNSIEVSARAPRSANMTNMPSIARIITNGNAFIHNGRRSGCGAASGSLICTPVGASDTAGRGGARKIENIR